MNKKKGMPTEVEPAFSAYLHAKAKKLGLPLAGNFELTSRCNFNCKMCYVHDNQNTQGELSAQEWIELGREAVGRGMVFLLLTGGEPFLREDFCDIYVGLKKLGLLLSINTNGSLIDGKMVDFLAKDPPMRMNISLYGANRESYRQLCGQPAFDQVTHNIRALHDAGIQIRLNSSFTPYNAEEIPGICQFARELELPLKATSYMFPPIRVNGCQYGQAPHRFTPEEAAQAMLRYREQQFTGEQLSKAWIVDPCGDQDCPDGQGDPMHCRAGKTAFWITWDGRMLPCGMFPGEGYSVAQMGFQEAWDAIRRDCAAVRLPATCSVCSYRTVCHACAASSLTECGNLTDPPEYICRMTKHLDRITREKYGREEPDRETK